jgi:hypothetical protein
MKVIVYDDYNIVTQIYNGIYNPKVDRDRGVITHSTGKIFGLNIDEGVDGFIIVEDHVPFEIGNVVNDDMKDYDQTHRYDDFTFEDVKRAVKEGVEELKEVFKKDKKDD